jgi:hypothetical protein
VESKKILRIWPGFNSTTARQVLYSASARRLSQLPNDPLPHAGTVLHNFGIFIDSDLGAWTHFRRTASRCLAALRQLRHFRRYVLEDRFRSLVKSLVHLRLNYDNFFLVGLPAYRQLSRQSVRDAAAYMIFQLPL